MQTAYSRLTPEPTVSNSENADKDGKGFIYIADGTIVAVGASSPDIKEDATYTLATGDVTNTVTMSSLIYGDDHMER